MEVKRKMNIRLAENEDLNTILLYDRHISREELANLIMLGRVYVAAEDGQFCGWLRYNLFWDNTPFMNLLYLLENVRGKGGGRALTEYWESEMRKAGYHTVMTSTQSDEYAQHFYQHLGYKAIGSFMPDDDPMEIILAKKLSMKKTADQTNVIFRTANETDLEAVFSMFSAAIDDMNRNSIFQWDEIYPDKAVLAEDIAKRQLSIGESDGAIVCAYVLNTESDEQYKNGAWHYRDSKYIVIHRLCVNPAYQNQGIAGLVMKHIETAAKACGIESIRLDAFTKNPFALRLYDRLGYRKVGTADWRKGRFYLMEKGL